MERSEVFFTFLTSFVPVQVTQALSSTRCTMTRESAERGRSVTRRHFGSFGIVTGCWKSQCKPTTPSSPGKISLHYAENLVHPKTNKSGRNLQVPHLAELMNCEVAEGHTAPHQTSPHSSEAFSALSGYLAAPLPSSNRWFTSHAS